MQKGDIIGKRAWRGIHEKNTNSCPVFCQGKTMKKQNNSTKIFLYFPLELF
jgi:hypothetical protein